MTTIAADFLSQKWGSADELISARTKDGFVDLSSIDWRRDVVVSNVKFTRARLERARVDANFVNCTFQKSEFDSVRSEGRFWGASDHWDDCSFTDLELTDVVSPNNVFSHCSFTRAHLREYNAQETRFDDCMFEDALFETFRALKSTMSGKPFAKLPPNSVTFRRCTFLRPTFRLCRFEHVAFEDCTIREPVIDRCDFTGILGDPWWRSFVVTDLFVTFLDELLSTIEKRLGADSVSYRHFSRYVEQYRAGETTSKDYSAPLFLPDVPDDEVDEIEEDMEKLERKFQTVL